jgi:hypothetical protein
MNEPINLNKARKERAKAAAKAKAAQNRVQFGRPKVESLTARLEAERIRRELDRKKRDD